MTFRQPSETDAAYFQSVLTERRVLIDEATLARCASDHTEDFYFPPKLVLQPTAASEVSEILRYCSTHHIPVTARGAGTGLSGGALPVMGGVVLDMRRMNQILKIDTENFQVVVEPGVITEELQNAVKEVGLYYPPDPASKGSCFIGGNIAENSGGPKALKYGVVKDYVLNLEIVLADGRIMWTGANVLKNSTGYNLTQLIVGSEGTLAIVTKIVLRLLPAPKHDLLLLVPFRSASEACQAVNQIFLSGHTPSALEFMERDALIWSMRFLQDPRVPIPDDIAAHLLIEVDGNHPAQLMQDIESIAELVSQFDIDEPLLAESQDQKNALWALRRKVGEAVKSNSVYKEEDTVVPRAKLPELLRCVKEIGAQYGFQSVCYGHAGDGNLHVNIIRGELSEQDWKENLPIAIRQIFQEVMRMGGTISGEHGIGLVQKEFLDIAFKQGQIELMRSIKNIFDPKGILNPGKIFQ